MKRLLPGLWLTGLAWTQDLPRFDVATPTTGCPSGADEHAKTMNEVEADASILKLPIGAREVLATYLASTSGSRWGEN